MLIFPFDVRPEHANERLVQFAATKLKRTARVLLKAVPIDLVEPNIIFRQYWEYKGTVIGFKLHTSLDRCPANSERYRSFWELANENGLIMLVHCGRWEEIASYKFALQSAALYPKAKVILAHMGGNELKNMLGAIETSRGLPNVYLETSNCRMSTMIAKAVEKLGAERILFGSDTPWGSVLPNVFTILESDILEIEKELILRRNLEVLLNKI